MKTKLAYAIAAAAIALTGCASTQDPSNEQTPTVKSDPATVGAESACIQRMSDLASAAKNPDYSELVTSAHGDGIFYTTGRLQGTLAADAFDYTFNCTTTQTGGTYDASLDVDYTSGNP